MVKQRISEGMDNLASAAWLTVLSRVASVVIAPLLMAIVMHVAGLGDRMSKLEVEGANRERRIAEMERQTQQMLQNSATLNAHLSATSARADAILDRLRLIEQRLASNNR